MDTQPLVPRAEIGMVAAAGAARVREDKHALGIGLERIGLAEIGRAGSGLDDIAVDAVGTARSEEHTSELQSLMRISYAVFCLKKKKKNHYKERCTTNLELTS